MKVVGEILQDLEILKRLLKHNANLKIRINYYLTDFAWRMLILLGFVMSWPISAFEKEHPDQLACKEAI